MNGNTADQLTPLIAAMLLESAGDIAQQEAPPTASLNVTRKSAGSTV